MTHYDYYVTIALMANYENIRNPDILATLASDQRYVEHLPSVGPCLAWEITQPKAVFPKELVNGLKETAAAGTTVMLDVRYREDGINKGTLFSTTTGSGGERSLQFVNYDLDTEGNPIVIRYNDSQSAPLLRFQQDQLTNRYLGWAATLVNGGVTHLPSDNVHDDFVYPNNEIIVDSAAIVVGVQSMEPDADIQEQYRFARLRRAIAEQLLPNAEEVVYAGDSSERVAGGGLAAWFRRHREHRQKI